MSTDDTPREARERRERLAERAREEAAIAAEVGWTGGSIGQGPERAAVPAPSTRRVITVQTTGGVTWAEQPAGEVKVIRQAEGDTLIELLALDGQDGVRVFLDYDQITQLMVALGREAADL